ncbi:type II secretion system F family protein [Kiritimatiellaeota bacterium B1221]|nr:type II secretion system F family protein [Kiritimatiellaeota bacterium B1221]
MTPPFSIELYLIPLAYFTCFFLMGYHMMSGLREAISGQSDRFSQSASRELENLFLFIPANRIASVSQSAGILGFLTGFLVFGDPTRPGGLLGGLMGGMILFFLIRLIPVLAIGILKKKRLEQFNLQLTEALVTMSNSLRAGFSVQQAFETIVQEGRKPIAQEFGVFVQQTRVGVRFEDALANMEERVKSEDLTLMVRAIEISRQTGGNLTEVFDIIAATIRERSRIEGKIKSMTAMGRLQGIVVGLVPIFLLLIMTVIDPKMMADFFSDFIGIALLVLVVILLGAGFFVIHKIVSIEV